MTKNPAELLANAAQQLETFEANARRAAQMFDSLNRSVAQPLLAQVRGLQEMEKSTRNDPATAATRADIVASLPVLLAPLAELNATFVDLVEKGEAIRLARK